MTGVFSQDGDCVRARGGCLVAVSRPAAGRRRQDSARGIRLHTKQLVQAIEQVESPDLEMHARAGVSIHCRRLRNGARWNEADKKMPASARRSSSKYGFGVATSTPAAAAACHGFTAGQARLGEVTSRISGAVAAAQVALSPARCLARNPSATFAVAVKRGFLALRRLHTQGDRAGLQAGAAQIQLTTTRKTP